MELKQRSSNLELFRILSMLVIVSGHYAIHSGLLQMVNESNTANVVRDYFLILFAWGGKTGINCFVLISGYFMCTSKITLRKYLKLLLEFWFYNIIITLVFIITGYENPTMEDWMKVFLPVTRIANDFTPCFFVFYLLIPFLNKLIYSLTEKEHLLLIILCVTVFTILPALKMEVESNYVVWFSVLFFISSYIRMYPREWMKSTSICGRLALVSLLLSWASCIIIKIAGKSVYYFFVSDSNTVLALSTSVLSFLYFRNLKIPHNKFINMIASSCFGVLLIHANSRMMKNWIWKDLLKAHLFFNSPYLIIHAISSVALVYIVCTIIDQVRINTVEKCFFLWYDSKNQNRPLNFN